MWRRWGWHCPKYHFVRKKFSLACIAWQVHVFCKMKKWTFRGWNTFQMLLLERNNRVLTDCYKPHYLVRQLLTYLHNSMKRNAQLVEKWHNDLLLPGNSSLLNQLIGFPKWQYAMASIHGLLFLKHDFYRTQVNLGSDSWVRLSVREWEVWLDLTDVTLAEEDTKSIPTDNAKRAIQGNVAMQVTEVTPSGGQLCN